MDAGKHAAVARRQLLKGAAAVGALAALEGAGIDRAAEAEAATPSLAGTWMIQTKSSSSTSMDLAAFTRDGIVIDAGSVPMTAPPAGQGNGPITIGLGSWTAAAAGGFNVRFASLGVDPKGAYAGTATIDAHVTLGATGNSFSGTYKVTGEAGGKIIFTDSGTVKAKRIKAPAM